MQRHSNKRKRSQMKSTYDEKEDWDRIRESLKANKIDPLSLVKEALENREKNLQSKSKRRHLSTSSSSSSEQTVNMESESSEAGEKDEDEIVMHTKKSDEEIIDEDTDTAGCSSGQRPGKPVRTRVTYEETSKTDATTPNTTTRTEHPAGREREQEHARIKNNADAKYNGLRKFAKEMRPKHESCCNRYPRRPCKFYNQGRCNLGEADHRDTVTSTLWGHFCTECYYLLGLTSLHRSICRNCPCKILNQKEHK